MTKREKRFTLSLMEGFDSCERCGGTGLIARGEHLRKIRIALNLTLKDIAARAKCSIPFVSDVERGRRDAPHRLKAAYGIK